jgi:tetratricopeptide (TPR) repeat protein
MKKNRIYPVKKRPCMIIIIITLFISASAVAPAAAEKKHARTNNGTPQNGITTEWSNYSWGLYYKNLALQQRKGPDREAYLKKAVHYFNEAISSGVSLEKIYFQLSECLFHRNDYAASLDYARKSLAIDNRDMRVYNRIYNIYLKQRNYDAAAVILEDYLKVKPESVQVLYILAEHYYQNLRDPEKATAAFKQVITLSDQVPIEDYFKERSYISLASIAYRKGDLTQAVEMYEQALNINKENLDAIYYLAVTYLEMYDLSGAERYSLAFLEKRPGDPVINSVLGRVYYLRDDFRAVSFLGKAKNNGSMSGILAWGLYCELLKKDDAALKLLESVMKSAPRTISIHLAMARINARKGDAGAAFNEYVAAGVLMFNNKLYEESKRCFTEAGRLNPLVPGVYYYLGKVYEETRNYSLAIYNYLRANSLQPDIDLMLHIGYLYGVIKDYDTAMLYFNRASAKEPANSRPHFFKGLMSIWQEDYPMAERHIRQAISLDDTSETYYFYMAIVMEKLSKLDRAIESLEKAIRYNPSSARAYNYLGYLYADNNMKIDESLGLIRKALEIEPDNGAYTDSLGWAYFRKGDYRLALEKLLAAEDLLHKANTPDPAVFDHIGDTYLRLGKIDDALRYWHRSNDIKKSDTLETKIKQYQNRK